MIETGRLILRHWHESDAEELYLYAKDPSVGPVAGWPPHTSIEDSREIIKTVFSAPETYWGQGLIPEAVVCLQRRAFAELGMKKMWCGYFDGNHKSRRVQEKCGFRYHHTDNNACNEFISGINTEHISCLSKEQWLSDQINK